MYPTLFVDAFGRLDPIPERVAPDPEYRPDPENPLDGYLWGTFHHRSEMMRWSTDGSAETSRVWDVEEAELTYHLGSSRIGFAQVELEVKGATAVEPAEMPMPDVLQPDIDLSQAGWAAVPTLDDGAPPRPPGVALAHVPGRAPANLAAQRTRIQSGPARGDTALRESTAACISNLLERGLRRAIRWPSSFTVASICHA